MVISVSRQSNIVNVKPDDISYEQFRDAIRWLNSPAIYDSEEAYNRLLHYPVSICAVLAIAIHDSRIGTEGINKTHNTKNVGNVRSSALNRGTVIDTHKGQFVRFDTYADGWEDIAARLVSTRYPYAKQNAITIEKIIPIYAPKSDNNNPEHYIVDVVLQMNRLYMGPDRYTKIDNINVVWIPSPTSNYNSGHDAYEKIVIHSIEGSAQSGINTLSNPLREASTHFVTDPDNQRIVQMVGTKSTAWTSGNYLGNSRGLNIENPGFAGRPFDPRVTNYCGRLVGVLSRDFDIPLVRLTKAQANTPGIKGVCAHADFEQNGPQSQWHYDPGHTWEWDMMFAAARNIGQTGTDGGGIIPPFFPATGYGVSGGIRNSFTDGGGVARYGYPRSREFDIIENGQPVRVQWFQRGRAEYAPNRNPNDHNVTWSLLGDIVLFDSLQTIADFRFHMNDAGFRWAFTPQSFDDWKTNGHNIPAHMRLF